LIADWTTSVRWSRQGNALLWVEADGLKVCRRGTTKVLRLLQWPSRVCRPFWAIFSPNGECILLVFFFNDGRPSLNVVVRVSTGAAVSIEGLPETKGMRASKSHAEWNEDSNEIVIAYDLAPAPKGGYKYRHRQLIRLTDLPTPWRLASDVVRRCDASTAVIPVRHRANDYSCDLPTMPGWMESEAAEMVLRDTGTGGTICIREIVAAAAGAGSIVGLVVVRQMSEGKYSLIGVSRETAAITELFSFELSGEVPPLLRLTFEPLRADGQTTLAQSFLVPTVASSASFACAAPEVETIAFWVAPCL